MKRFITLIMCAALLLAGCSSGVNSGTAAGSGSTTTGSTESLSSTNSGDGGSIRVGLAMSSRDQYFAGLQKQLEANLSQYDSVEIVGIYEADYDVSKQLEQVSTLMTLNCDVIISSIVDTNNAEAVLDLTRGTPFVMISRHPPTELLEKYDNVRFVGSPEVDAGILQGEWLAEFFEAQGQNAVNYVLFMGPLGLENAMERTRGAKLGLEQGGMAINKIFEDTAEWDRAEAMSKMQQILAANDNIDCVIANNDEMALGAIEALKSAGRLEGIPVVGVDATVNGMTAVMEGEMAMTVLQNAVDQAAVGVEVAMKMINGEHVDLETWVPFEAVTIENVEYYMENFAY